MKVLCLHLTFTVLLRRRIGLLPGRVLWNSKNDKIRLLMNSLSTTGLLGDPCFKIQDAFNDDFMQFKYCSISIAVFGYKVLVCTIYRTQYFVFGILVSMKPGWISSLNAPQMWNRGIFWDGKGGLDFAHITQASKILVKSCFGLISATPFLTTMIYISADGAYVYRSISLP